MDTSPTPSQTHAGPRGRIVRPDARIAVYADGMYAPLLGGQGAYGYVILQAGTRIARGSGILSPHPSLSCNMAEYMAAEAALRALLSSGYRGSVELRTDSRLLVRHLTGRSQVRSAALVDAAHHLLDLARQFSRVRWRWIPRTANREADALSRAAGRATPRYGTHPA